LRGTSKSNVKTFERLSLTVWARLVNISPGIARMLSSGVRSGSRSNVKFSLKVLTEELMAPDRMPSISVLICGGSVWVTKVYRSVDRADRLLPVTSA